MPGRLLPVGDHDPGPAPHLAHGQLVLRVRGQTGIAYLARRGMPLQITAEHGHWRRVQDRDGAGGWVHYALISGSRTVLIEKDMVEAHTRPAADSPVAALFEIGVVAKLGSCDADWCRISAGGHKGWVEKADLWGVAPDEIRK